MAAATTSNMSAILKAIWPKGAQEELLYEDSPLFAMLEKDTSWVGSTREIPIHYGQINGRSADFTKAKANKNPSKVKKMSVDTADNFAVWSVGHKLIQASRNDAGAVVRAVESQTKSAMIKFKRSICWALYGNGGGAIGQGDSSYSVAGSTITLSSARDARNFEEGDVLNFAANDGYANGTPTAVRTGTVTVTAVDPGAGTVTVAETINSAISGAANSDYIFIEGDYNATMKGLPFYVSPAAAASATIWGMTRTANPERLAGIRVGGKGLIIEEAIKKALKRSKDANAAISHIFCNTAQFNDLDSSLGTRRRYADEKVGSVGFTGLEFATRGGGRPIRVFEDADCPENLVYGLRLDTWTLGSMGDYPDFLTLDGKQYITEESANSFEGRIGGYAQLYTNAPGWNFRLDLTSSTP